MHTSNIKVIGATFQKVADIVLPTMGAKGRMAVLAQDMDRPLLTDDGVTVAAECYYFDNQFEKMIATSMIEAARNTEKEAFDGTTLTILLTNEFYKLGYKWIRKGMHPQASADTIEILANEIRQSLAIQKFPINPKLVKDLATISTKIPAVGDLVFAAYKKAGDGMNIIIEHDRENTKTSVQHTDGMVLESGYKFEVMTTRCNEGDKTVYENAHIVLLSQDFMTSGNINDFFRSIPEDHVKDPFVFFMTPKFNPESFQFLLETLSRNQMQFQFVYIHEELPEELYMDIAAKTNGLIQDVISGSNHYLYQHCGLAGKIVIEQDKTTITQTEGDVRARVEKYQKELDKDKFVISSIRTATVKRRLSALTSGVVKIKLAVPTITEFQTIRMKLDDAIGAVRCAIRNGLLRGAGKALSIVAQEYKGDIKKLLHKPAMTIASNAGLKLNSTTLKSKDESYNVKTKEYVHLIKDGIVDSFDSIDASVKNSASIASNYLRAYILIHHKK